MADFVTFSMTQAILMKNQNKFEKFTNKSKWRTKKYLDTSVGDLVIILKS